VQNVDGTSLSDFDLTISINLYSQLLSATGRSRNTLSYINTPARGALLNSRTKLLRRGGPRCHTRGLCVSGPDYIPLQLNFVLLSTRLGALTLESPHPECICLPRIESERVVGLDAFVPISTGMCLLDT